MVQHKPLRNLDGQVCEICGDEVGVTVDGDLFVACNECGFPVCRPCYEYERREGSQNCPQCKTRYKRLKGSPRVDGDDDEEDVDDIEHEFNMNDQDDQHNNNIKNNEQIADAMLHGKMSYGRGPDDEDNSQFPPVIAGVRSRPVISYSDPPTSCIINTSEHRYTHQICFRLNYAALQVSGELTYLSHGYGDQPSSLHKRVHPYPLSEHGT